MVRGILELVDELTLSIIEEIDDLDALRSLARTCSRLQKLVEPVIYRNIFVRTRRDALALANSLVNRPDRLHAIRSIDSRQKYEGRECRLDVLLEIIQKARNVRQLTIESPYCNRIQPTARYGWAESMNALLRPVVDFSLPRLTSVTLHLSLEDKRYWPIDRSFVMMFAHPTLRSLKLSCATIGDGAAASLEGRPPTPLKQLALVECNVTQKALRSILALPAALEDLSLGENCVHGNVNPGNFNRLFWREPVAFLTSLRQQHRSLRTLGYATKGDIPDRDRIPGSCHPMPLGFDPHECNGLSSFEYLSHISLQGCSLEFENIFTTPDIAPPALRRLTLQESELGTFLRSELDAKERALLPWIPSIGAVVKSLQTIEVVASAMPLKIIEASLADVESSLRGNQLCVRMYRRAGMGTKPPFLYGERAYLDEEKGFEKVFKPETLLDNCIQYS